MRERTIRRWKKIFLGLYLVFTMSAIIVTSVSVVFALFGRSPPPTFGSQIGPRADKVTELRTCHRDLDRLLTDLHKETFTIQARALRFDTDPTTEWRNWSESWQLRWRQVGWRCRLGELPGGTSQEIDRMAVTHQSLSELQLSYSRVMDKFIESYVDRLHRLRKDLVEIRVLIDRRRPRANAIPTK